MRANEIMNLLVYRCHERDTVADCAKLMSEQNIGFVPVVDGDDRLVGVVTDRDLVLRVLAQGRPLTTPVGEVATRAPLVTCTAEEELRLVEEKMAEARKARVPVIDDQRRCLGIISLSNVAQVETSTRRVGSLLNLITHREAVQIAHTP